jgi:hypothetical protein
MKNKISLVILLTIFFSFFSNWLAAEENPTENNIQANTETNQETINENNTDENNINKTESLENEIEKVEITWENQVKIYLKENINFKNSYVNWEFKILKWVKILNAIKDPTNPKIVKLNLAQAIEKNSSYNILDINWNWSIDFDTKTNLINEEIKNQDLTNESAISSIIIVDPTHINLIFKNNLSTEDFSFNMFEIMKISNILWNNEENSITITLDKNLDKNWSYILTILDLKTSEWNKIEFSDNWYKEFSWNTNTEEENTDFLTNQENQLEDLQTAQTAQETEQTPDTWTATNVLLILTFILSTIYFVYSRKKV